MHFPGRERGRFPDDKSQQIIKVGGGVQNPAHFHHPGQASVVQIWLTMGGNGIHQVIPSAFFLVHSHVQIPPTNNKAKLNHCRAHNSNAALRTDLFLGPRDKVAQVHLRQELAEYKVKGIRQLPA
ncbi:MAG: hypothetical protein IPL78_00715 [Chloroflexi bacterium]|nr:hypothetical protein [Chloroflexota bacterium]